MAKKMNWDRVKSENIRARHTDYSARMDEAEARAELEATFDAIRSAERLRRSPGAPLPPKRPVRQPPRALPPPGSEERRRLVQEAARRGTTPAALLRAPQERRPAPNPPLAANATKRERDEVEASRLGITIEELRHRRQAETAANQALHDRAVQLGITVKELRRRLKAS
jgi:hypothetical protein